MKKFIALAAVACAFVAVADEFFGPVTPAKTQAILVQKAVATSCAYTDSVVSNVTGNVGAISNQVAALEVTVASNKTEAAEAVAAVKSVQFNVTEYGFNENLRNNQVIANTTLVDAVLAKKDVMVVIKAGDYTFVAGKYLVANDATLGSVKGFAAANADITSADLQSAISAYNTTGTLPSTGVKSEKILFVAVGGKTYLFYLNN